MVSFVCLFFHLAFSEGHKTLALTRGKDGLPSYPRVLLCKDKQEFLNQIQSERIREFKESQQPVTEGAVLDLKNQLATIQNSPRYEGKYKNVFSRLETNLKQWEKSPQGMIAGLVKNLGDTQHVFREISAALLESLGPSLFKMDAFNEGLKHQDQEIHLRTNRISEHFLKPHKYRTLLQEEWIDATKHLFIHEKTYQDMVTDIAKAWYDFKRKNSKAIDEVKKRNKEVGKDNEDKRIKELGALFKKYPNYGAYFGEADKFVIGRILRDQIQNHLREKGLKFKGYGRTELVGSDKRYAMEFNVDSLERNFELAKPLQAKGQEFPIMCLEDFDSFEVEQPPLIMPALTFLAPEAGNEITISLSLHPRVPTNVPVIVLKIPAKE